MERLVRASQMGNPATQLQYPHVHFLLPNGHRQGLVGLLLPKAMNTWVATDLCDTSVVSVTVSFFGPRQRSSPNLRLAQKAAAF